MSAPARGAERSVSVVTVTARPSCAARSLAALATLASRSCDLPYSTRSRPAGRRRDDSGGHSARASISWTVAGALPPSTTKRTVLVAAAGSLGVIELDDGRSHPVDLGVGQLSEHGQRQQPVGQAAGHRDRA